jgi:RNA polymerase sigma-70 factor (ECF subfamily)
MIISEQIQNLINRCKQGDREAFGRLVGEYQYPVFRLAFRLLNNTEDAKDVAQEVFIKIWQKLHKYNCQYKFSTWIYKITANICYDKLRAMKYSKNIIALPDIKHLSLISSDDIEAEIINKDLKELILYFTNDLTPKQKLIFTLKDIEELETGEIEEITGLSAAKIKSNLYLARNNIKNKINKIV